MVLQQLIAVLVVFLGVEIYVGLHKMEKLRVDWENKHQELKEEFDLKAKVEHQQLHEEFSSKLTFILKHFEEVTQLQEKRNAEVKEILNDIQRKPTVAFKATYSGAYNIVRGGKTIVFPVVIMNVGSGYDRTSGVFTAPVNGTYLFTTVLCMKNYFIFAMFVDGNKQPSRQLYGDKWAACYSADAIAVLTTGQKVWVQVLPASKMGELYQDNNRWSTFSGVLVNA